MRARFKPRKFGSIWEIAKSRTCTLPWRKPSPSKVTRRKPSPRSTRRRSGCGPRAKAKIIAAAATLDGMLEKVAEAHRAMGSSRPSWPDIMPRMAIRRWQTPRYEARDCSKRSWRRSLRTPRRRRNWPRRSSISRKMSTRLDGRSSSRRKWNPREARRSRSSRIARSWLAARAGSRRLHHSRQARSGARQCHPTRGATRSFLTAQRSRKIPWKRQFLSE